MSAPLFFLCVDIANIVCSLLLAARVLTQRPRLLSAQLIALICFNTICYIVLSRQEYGWWIPEAYRFEVGSGLGTFLNFARNLTPGLFMILCFTLFADRPRFPRWLLALFLAEMFLEVPMRWMSGGAVGDFATRVAPAFLQTLFAGIALYWTSASWRADLIERRRHARVLVIVVIGLNIIGSTLFLRVLVAQNSVQNYYVHLALVLSNLPLVLFILSYLRLEDLQVPIENAPQGTLAAPAADVDPEAARILARLSALMEHDRIYRRPSLSIKELAVLVQAPEYRLRKVIHEQLGYPNFNVFLHDYRIREACLQLRDPAMRRIPILTIALSTGYQSINTFNRGFREIIGSTPSAYRAMDEAKPPPDLKKISPETS